MGIYENRTTSGPVKWANGATTHWELSDPGHGQTRRRLVVSLPWVNDPRETCYCCTCDPDGGGTDFFCRNHGHLGTRPCEKHGMSGDTEEQMTAAWHEATVKL